MESGFMLWIKHNIAEAVAEFFTDSTGRTENMLLIKSDILKHVGKMKIELMEEPGEDEEHRCRRPFLQSGGGEGAPVSGRGSLHSS